LSRLPIRLRLTLAFALAISFVLAGTGLFLYLRVSSALDQTINQGLRARATDVAALAQQADTGLRNARRPLPGPSGGFAQVLAAKGGVVDATPGLPPGSLLSKSELARAGGAPSLVSSTVRGEHVRLLAVPVHAQGRTLVVVVGSSLEPRQSALADLRTQLLLGGPIALLLASLAGYMLAAAALRPVERMGEQAATISASSPGRRLPVPAGEDELARLGRRLNEMLARLEAALERERHFVADAGHELRTPLALLKTEIELALDKPESAPALQAALRSAGEETDRLSRLAEDLLFLARADADALPIRRSRVELADVLAAVAARYQRRANDLERRIETDAPAQLTILADRLRLEQALANLVDNALRYGAGTIRLQAAERDGRLELHVTDEGEGFPPDFLDRAFERFSRPDQSRSRAGAGLGLGIVATIANAHDGTATAANRPNGGAEVTLALPLQAPASDEKTSNNDTNVVRRVRAAGGTSD
jgi:heavy metal sensor kinase